MTDTELGAVCNVKVGVKKVPLKPATLNYLSDRRVEVAMVSLLCLITRLWLSVAECGQVCGESVLSVAVINLARVVGGAGASTLQYQEQPPSKYNQTLLGHDLHQRLILVGDCYSLLITVAAVSLIKSLSGSVECFKFSQASDCQSGVKAAPTYHYPTWRQETFLAHWCPTGPVKNV